MRRALILATMAVVVMARWASADCGGIPFNPKAQIYEPNQRAMIAFDGSTEILLLAQDLRASAPTKVLQVLPLPSEPQVADGDLKVFVRATDLINKKLGRDKKMNASGGSGGMMGGGSGALLPAGEVTFHDKIGSHDISVTHVRDRQGFLDWVETYLRKAGVDNPTIPDAMKTVVGEYLADRFQWFVFDVVEVGTDVKTKDAIRYHFPTHFLYYPLRITRSETGDTHVRLLVLSRSLVRIPELGKAKIRLMHDPIWISPSEVKALGDEDIAKLLKGHSCMLRTWEVDGPLSGFTKDIVTSRTQ